jgi:hypothetical protein
MVKSIINLYRIETVSYAIGSELMLFELSMKYFLLINWTDYITGGVLFSLSPYGLKSIKKISLNLNVSHDENYKN